MKISDAESPWHALDANKVWELVGSSIEGLSTQEATRRLQETGANVLPQPASPNLTHTLVRQLKSPLIAVLGVAAMLSAVVGDEKDALLISAVVAVNAVIGGLQEWKAHARCFALRQLIKVQAIVLRDRKKVELNSESLVIGDAIWLESGQVVPADVRLVDSHNLEIDESLLTGESGAVQKRAKGFIAAKAPLAERSTMAYAGTTVSRGRGLGVVVATGKTTEVGDLASDLQTVPPGKPPLVVRMDLFSKRVGVFVIISAAAVGWLSIAQGGTDLLTALKLAVALAVSAIPEGLPVALTVALSVASHRMAKQKVIVRRLPAVEGLGSCTLIASDKTGTLTYNQLSVQEVVLRGEPPIRLDLHQKEKRENPRQLERLLPIARCAVLCNEGEVYKKDDWWEGRGDPTDQALLIMGIELGVSKQKELLEQPQCNTIPFEPEQRYAASFHQRDDGEVMVAVKGAPERIIPMCQPEAQWGMEAAEELANRGLRVLALASGTTSKSALEETTPSEPGNLQLLGVIGLRDPLRRGAKEAIDQCHQAGIRVWIVTGDHPTTAGIVGKELGIIKNTLDVVTGAEIEAASPESLKRIVSRANVYARVSPHQKLLLVEQAQKDGEFVAVTGDGVNDAPALRAAQIGIAMGRAGTDVARDAADLILLDDGFPSIVDGIQQGRIAYDNVRKVIVLLVSCGAAEITVLALAVGFSLPLPLLPVQLLWLNLVTNGIQDVALAFEPEEGDVLKRRPRPPQEAVFNGLLIKRTALAAVVMGGVGFILFSELLKHGWGVEQARNALLLQMVMFETVQAGNSRLERKSVFHDPPWHSPVVVAGTAGGFALHVWMMNWGVGSAALGTGPLPVDLWLVISGLSLCPLVAVEIQKTLVRRKVL